MDEATILRRLPDDVRRDGWELSYIGELGNETVYSYHDIDGRIATPFVVYINHDSIRVQSFLEALPTIDTLLKRLDD
ncbi:hypothetical protein [uncultured Tessaracoccus sp.]|uniref:hypothetical protein n=1 Tax=uncultured Tessaracoccus sp. TaxID=905023 RepID=UPI0025EA9547|nr:hypothetical protein [uncultured Tessaracoccus sp.]